MTTMAQFVLVAEGKLALRKEGELPPNAVYTLYFKMNEHTVPFYVGETGRFPARLGDYKSGHFDAATDFRVKQAIMYFFEKWV